MREDREDIQEQRARTTMFVQRMAQILYLAPSLQLAAVREEQLPVQVLSAAHLEEMPTTLVRKMQHRRQQTLLLALKVTDMAAAAQAESHSALAPVEEAPVAQVPTLEHFPQDAELKTVLGSVTVVATVGPVSNWTLPEVQLNTVVAAAAESTQIAMLQLRTAGEQQDVRPQAEGVVMEICIQTILQMQQHLQRRRPAAQQTLVAAAVELTPKILEAALVEAG